MTGTTWNLQPPSRSDLSDPPRPPPARRTNLPHHQGRADPADRQSRPRNRESGVADSHPQEEGEGLGGDREQAVRQNRGRRGCAAEAPEPPAEDLRGEQEEGAKRPREARLARAEGRVAVVQPAERHGGVPRKQEEAHGVQEAPPGVLQAQARGEGHAERVSDGDVQQIDAGVAEEGGQDRGQHEEEGEGGEEQGVLREGVSGVEEAEGG